MGDGRRRRRTSAGAYHALTRKSASGYYPVPSAPRTKPFRRPGVGRAFGERPGGSRFLPGLPAPPAPAGGRRPPGQVQMGVGALPARLTGRLRAGRPRRPPRPPTPPATVLTKATCHRHVRPTPSRSKRTAGPGAGHQRQHRHRSGRPEYKPSPLPAPAIAVVQRRGVPARSARAPGRPQLQRLHAPPSAAPPGP